MLISHWNAKVNFISQVVTLENFIKSDVSHTKNFGLINFEDYSSKNIHLFKVSRFQTLKEMKVNSPIKTINFSFPSHIVTNILILQKEFSSIFKIDFDNMRIWNWITKQNFAMTIDVTPLSLREIDLGKLLNLQDIFFIFGIFSFYFWDIFLFLVTTPLRYEQN